MRYDVRRLWLLSDASKYTSADAQGVVVVELTVTLVHGTFARCAAWTQEGSPLSVELREHFGDSVAIDRFCWSGDNTVFARLIAGVELAEHMDRVKEKYPSARHYIVAHSHGGNVALYAAERAAQVDGVISLATPFFDASARDEALMGKEATQRGLNGAASLFLFLVFTSMTWKTWFIVTASYGVVCALLAVVASALMGVLVRSSGQLADYTTAKVPPKTMFCAFRVTGDEASLSLASGQLFAWATTKLYSYMVRTKEWEFLAQPFRNVPLPIAFWFVPVLSACAVAAGYLWGPDKTSSDALLFDLGGWGIKVSMLVFAWAKTKFFDGFLYGLSFILLLMASLMGVFLVGARPPAEEADKGPRGWMFALGCSIAVAFNTEATPHGGPWPILHFPQYFAPLSKGEFAIAHSIYNNPEVRTKVVECLERFISY